MAVCRPWFGLQEYEIVWRNMQDFTQSRCPETPDELWLLEHYPVYTLGLNGKREHLLNIEQVPVVACDRGGQVTYHGPGQAVVYTLLDLGRLQLTARQLVSQLERSMVAVLAGLGVIGYALPEAPGVYVGGKKIGSVGLRIKKNCSYHGLSLNNRMALEPFRGINPCGYAGLEVTQLANFGVNMDTIDLAQRIAQQLKSQLSL